MEGTGEAILFVMLFFAFCLCSALPFSAKKVLKFFIVRLRFISLAGQNPPPVSRGNTAFTSQSIDIDPLKSCHPNVLLVSGLGIQSSPLWLFKPQGILCAHSEQCWSNSGYNTRAWNNKENLSLCVHMTLSDIRTKHLVSSASQSRPHPSPGELTHVAPQRYSLYWTWRRSMHWFTVLARLVTLTKQVK